MAHMEPRSAVVTYWFSLYFLCEATLAFYKLDDNVVLGYMYSVRVVVHFREQAGASLRLLS